MSKEYIKPYIPTIYENNETMKAIYKVEANEIEKINNETNKIINNNFIASADLDGIKKIEEFLQIYPNSDFTLEERRANVLNRMLFTPPFTRQKLDKILFNIYGQGGYTFEIYPDKYQVIIDINTNNPTIYLQFNNDVRNIIPANMELLYAIQYTYLYLHRKYTHDSIAQKKLTYGQLSQYSSNEIKE